LSQGLNHPVGIPLLKDLCQRLVTVSLNVVFDLRGIDLAAIAEDDFYLPFEKIDLADSRHVPAIRPTVGETLDNLSLQEMLTNELGGIFRTDVFVHDVFHHEDRSTEAWPHAARSDDPPLLSQPHFLKVLLKGFFCAERSGGDATGACANADFSPPVLLPTSPSCSKLVTPVGELFNTCDPWPVHRHLPVGGFSKPKITATDMRKLSCNDVFQGNTLDGKSRKRKIVFAGEPPLRRFS
jgi:hypothetical protein